MHHESEMRKFKQLSLLLCHHTTVDSLAVAGLRRTWLAKSFKRFLDVPGARFLAESVCHALILRAPD